MADWIVDNPRDLGRRIRERRIGLGLTQIDVAGVARVTPRLVGELEGGKETARIDGVLRVLAALGLDVHLRTR
jgi:y4mF family transcriptional regulator